MKSNFILLTLIFQTFLAWGQDHLGLYESATFKNETGELNYRIMYPENFDANMEYPVVLFLHGSGERGSDNQKQLVHGSKLFAHENTRSDYPAVVIFPQCPREDYWVNADVDRSSLPFGILFKKENQPTKSMQLVIDLMDSIQSLNYSKDDQIYVGGLSMGGMGTFDILRFRPEMFAASFPICGGADPDITSQYNSNLNIWVFHGARDNVVLPGYSTDMVIAMRKAGIDTKYTLYKNANHNSWDSTFAEPGLLPWLFSKTLKP